MATPSYEKGSSEPGTRAFVEQASKLGHDAREFGSMAAESVEKAAGRLKEQGREALEEGRERLQRTASQVEKYVAARPLTSILIALGVGALIGISIRR